jgi:hypothetical protein
LVGEAAAEEARVQINNDGKCRREEGELGKFLLITIWQKARDKYFSTNETVDRSYVVVHGTLDGKRKGGRRRRKKDLS